MSGLHFLAFGLLACLGGGAVYLAIMKWERGRLKRDPDPRVRVFWLCICAFGVICLLALVQVAEKLLFTQTDYIERLEME